MTVRHIEHPTRLAPADAGSAARTLLGLALHAITTVWNAAEDIYAKLQHRKGVRNMLELDEHLLRDMGVTRADILRASNLPFSQSAGKELARASHRNRSLR